jgi:hypothetical protein
MASKRNTLGVQPATNTGLFQRPGARRAYDDDFVAAAARVPASLGASAEALDRLRGVHARLLGEDVVGATVDSSALGAQGGRLAPAGGAITPEAFTTQLPPGGGVEAVEAALTGSHKAYLMRHGGPQAPEAQAGSR